MPTYVTESSAQIHARVDAVPSVPGDKSWATFEGGDPEAETSQLFPGAGISAVAIPGPVKRTAVTVTRPYTTDMHAVVNLLEANLNSAMSAWYTPTDPDGNTLNADTISYTGILKSVKKPKWDAASGKVGMISLVMECNS